MHKAVCLIDLVLVVCKLMPKLESTTNPAGSGDFTDWANLEMAWKEPVSIYIFVQQF